MSANVPHQSYYARYSIMQRLGLVLQSEDLLSLVEPLQQLSQDIPGVCAILRNACNCFFTGS